MNTILKRAGAVTLAAVLALILIPWFSVITRADGTADVNIQVTYGQSAARSMLDYINKFRAGNDVDGQKADYLNKDNTTKTDLTGQLSPLTYDYSLERTAMQRAAEIAMSFDHTRPNGEQCFTAWDGTWYAAGENIAAGYSSAYDTFVQWREDNEDYYGQGHRRNMLNGNFTRIGIGHVYFNGVHYWTHAFGKGTGDDTATAANDADTVVTVQVKTSDIQNLTVSAAPEKIDLNVGENKALPTASASFHLPESWPGNNYAAQVNAAWTSSDSAIASVNGNQVTGAAKGTTALTATVLGQNLSVPVTVAETGGGGETPGGGTEIIDSGTYGTNNTWTLDNEGTLTISGSGKTPGWDGLYEQPWGDSTRIKKAVIENGITGLGDSIFEGCKNLKTIEIAETVTSIGWSAFKECTNLVDIDLPYGLKSLAGDAFAGCSSLTDIVIPASVTELGNALFDHCSSLGRISVDPQNKVYDSRDNCNAIVETATNTLFAGCKTTSIPASVTAIGDAAFFGCTSLSNITIPSNIISIKYHAFEGCNNLTSVYFTSGVKEIDSYAFRRCERLNNIVIPASVTNISNSVFSGCDSLSSIKVDPQNEVYDSRDNCNAIINSNTDTVVVGCKNTAVPATVTGIGKGAFSGCTGLTSIVIPKNVSAIDENAFSYCSRLTNIVISDGVTRIGKFAFGRCSSLENITIPDSVTSIGDGAFTGCSELRRIEVPAGIKRIGESTFAECTGLTSVTIPDSVTSIGESAFFKCSSLKSVVIPKSVVEIGENAIGMYETWQYGMTVYRPIDGFVLYGYPDSAAEEYAKTTGVTFEIVGTHTHQLKKTEKKAATCEEAGNIEYWSCDTCKKLYADAEGKNEISQEDTVIAALGHKAGEKVRENEIAATCKTEGSYDEVTYCTVCKTELNRAKKVIPAAGHKLAKVSAKSATIKAAGIKAHYRCKTCGKLFSDNKETKEIKKSSITIPKLTPTIQLSATKKSIKTKKSFTLAISKLAKGDSVTSVKSGKTSIATVKKAGTNKYKITGKKKGKAVITVALKSGKKATCTVTVK